MGSARGGAQLQLRRRCLAVQRLLQCWPETEKGIGRKMEWGGREGGGQKGKSRSRDKDLRREWMWEWTEGREGDDWGGKVGKSDRSGP